jgi:hypothetical protein
MSDPTPQDRADYLVRKLEQFIRDGRTVRGVSFRDWQAMARSELANSFAEVDQRRLEIQKDLAVRRFLLVASVTLVTIGFWGGVMALDKSREWLAALIMLGAGTILLFYAADFSIRRLWNRGAAKQRRERFQRIESFDRQLRQLEAEIRQKLKKAEADALEAG